MLLLGVRVVGEAEDLQRREEEQAEGEGRRGVSSHVFFTKAAAADVPTWCGDLAVASEGTMPNDACFTKQTTRHLMAGALKRQVLRTTRNTSLQSPTRRSQTRVETLHTAAMYLLGTYGAAILPSSWPS